MALDKLVDGAQLDSDLASVANAIRTKGGTSAQLAFPADFVSAVNAIQTGGGGGYTDGLIDRTITSISWNGQSIGGFAFAGASRLTSISFPNVTSIGGSAFQNAGVTELTEAQFPSLTVITTDAFYGANKATRAFFPNTELPSSQYRQFRYCSSLVTAVVKSAGNNAFDGCNKLTIADITDGNIGSYTFGGCSLLSSLVLRKVTIASLGGANTFNNTPFKSGGAGGTIYIPKALYDHLGDGSALDYKAATNWSTILGYANNQILPIEGSIYETQYADGTPIT